MTPTPSVRPNALTKAKKSPMSEADRAISDRFRFFTGRGVVGVRERIHRPPALIGAGKPASSLYLKLRKHAIHQHRQLYLMPRRTLYNTNVFFRDFAVFTVLRPFIPL